MDIPDADALERLWDQHAAALWRYAFGLTGDAARAEDVVQAALLRAWQHPGGIDGSQPSPRAWLFTVARTLAVDGHRSARPYAGALAADGSAPPDRALVADALEQLSIEDRGVLRRAYYQGWTTAQIATDLGIAEGAVKSRLHYALRTLRQRLQEMGVAG